jgi:hypothetical protein
VTCLTQSVPDPTGFALACQTDKGLAPDVDCLALRRAEDEEAMALLGATEVVHLPLPEAPHRGYGSAAELLAGGARTTTSPRRSEAPSGSTWRGRSACWRRRRPGRGPGPDRLVARQPLRPALARAEGARTRAGSPAEVLAVPAGAPWHPAGPAPSC